MTKFRTVLGDIDSQALGITDAHAHVLMRIGLILLKQADFRLDDEQKSIEELQDYFRFGGRTVIDSAPLSIGRDPDPLERISQQSGVRIVAATRFHKTKCYLESHWRYRRSFASESKLLVAGRCFSATHDAHSSVRRMAQCMAMGQAAGRAAVLACESGVQPRELRYCKFRDALLDLHATLETRKATAAPL